MQIRPETPEDRDAVFEVERTAFGGQGEAILVDRLREASQLAISLVAIVDGRVVGHVAFSPMTLPDAPPKQRAVGLAPLAVLPAHQGRDIGSRLVRAGLRACAEDGWDLAFVLGEPAFYQRFGFTDAAAHGLRWDHDALAGAFMVMERRPGALGMASGVARCRPVFEKVWRATP